MKSTQPVSFEDINKMMTLAESLFSQMNLGLIIYHLEDAADAKSLKLLYANHQASVCTGADLSILVEKYILEAFPSLADTRIPELYARVVRQQKPLDVGTIEYKDQKIKPNFFEVKAFPIPQNCVGIVFKNISARKRGEAMIKQYTDELREKNNELEKFVSLASHDLKSPLRQLHLNAEALLERIRSDLSGEDRDYLHKIIAAADRMITLVENLLAYARAGKKIEKFAVVDLNQVLKDVLVDLEHRLQETGGSVKADSLGRIEAVPIEMHMLLLNLVSNGLKYRRPEVPPLVEVSGKKLQDSYQLVVKDNGIGFDNQFAEKIFQPFQRLHGKDSDYQGEGIGLATCMKVVKHHGGTISAKGVIDQGAVFTVTLPLKQVGEKTD